MPSSIRSSIQHAHPLTLSANKRSFEALGYHSQEDGVDHSVLLKSIGLNAQEAKATQVKSTYTFAQRVPKAELGAMRLAD